MSALSGTPAPSRPNPDAQRAPQHAFIRGKPLEPQFGRDGKRFIGNGSLRGPQPVRRFSENSLVVAARPRELFASIFRMAERGRGQRRSGIRDARDVGVAQQRKNGVIKRRRRNFDLPRGSRFPVFGQHAPEKLDLLFAKLLLVLLP